MTETVPPNAFAWPFTVTADMIDVQGHVANHEIVRILVEVAARHSEALGWDVAAYRELGAWWVVKRHEVDYLSPAREGDELVCYTWPSAFTKATAQRRHVLVRPTDDAVVARAVNTWALIDIETARPRRIAGALIETFDPAQWA